MNKLDFVAVSFDSKLVEAYEEAKKHYESFVTKSQDVYYHANDVKITKKEEFQALSKMQALKIQLLESQIKQLETALSE